MKKKKDKEWLKKLIPAYVLSFALSFMLFFNEPLIMYTTNKDDFAFDLYTIILPLIIVTLVVLISLSLAYTALYFICKKIFKKNTVFNIILIISYIVFFLLYIQGNYLIANLPPLDGSTMTWNSFTKDNIVTIIILLIIIGVYIFFIKKYKMDKVINTSKYVSLAVCAMLFVALLSTSITNNIFEDKRVMVYSNENINKISKNNNLLIFLLDQVDSKTFYNELQNSEKYKDILDNFTYYPNTLGAYPFTRDSLPFILSGKWNHNETGFRDYVNNAMDNSPLIDNLKNYKYDINIYDHQFRWSTDKVFETKNIIEYTSSMSPVCFAKEELRYISFKYLPYFLKQFSKMDTFDFDYCKMTSTGNAFKWDDTINYQTLTENKLELQDNNYFHFYHIQGAHYPRTVTEDVQESVELVDYPTMVRASINIIDKYLARIKESGAYDNSAIIIMADHGYDDGSEDGRQNPILFVKGFNEKHKMLVSDAPVSYEDLQDLYKNLLDGKKSTELFQNMAPNRVRNYILYVYNAENHMEECTQQGNAQDKTTIKKTGKVFDR